MIKYQALLKVIDLPIWDLPTPHGITAISLMWHESKEKEKKKSVYNSPIENTECLLIHLIADAFYWHKWHKPSKGKQILL